MTHSLNQKLLFLVSATPYAGLAAQEALEAVLMGAVFAPQACGVLFVGAGVSQILQPQKADVLDRKNLSLAWSSLPLYEVEAVYAQKPAVGPWPSENLCVPVQWVDAEESQQLIRAYDVVLPFGN